jgi:periplasmic protein TonB
MAQPLRTDDPAPQNMQFAHFGVLNDGNQSKGSLLTAIVLNVLLAFCAVVIGAAAKKTIDNRHKLTSLTEPIPIKKAEEPPPPPKIKIKLPPPPPVAKVEPPKIKLPDLKVPEPPKPPEIKMVQPVPVVMPVPPKLVQAPPAPKVVNLAQAMPAAVPNTSAHPTAVALGSTTNPIAVSNRPSPTAINLGNKGMSGMPASNNGAGAASTVVSLGSGSPTSQNMKATGPVAIAGIPHGVTGGTGPVNSKAVSLGQNTPPPMPKPAGPTTTTAKSGPKVLFKPKPEYTAEAVKLHIEGNVTVRIKVSSSGSVQVLGVISDLGHGLGDSAVRAIEATRFKPATDDSGNPVDWEGVVNVAFQLAG